MFYYEIGRERQLFVDNMLVAESCGGGRRTFIPCGSDGAWDGKQGDDLSRFAGEWIALRIAVQNATLYSFWFD